jgi:uncharacterized protein (TIGR02246 family)
MHNEASMTAADRPPIMALTWRGVVAFLFIDALITTAIIVWFISLANAAPVTPSSVDAIRAVLDNQVVAWNRGDLDSFMAGYWKDDRLTFFSGDTITKGWQATYDRYRKRYQSEGREMGKLEFRRVDVEMAGPDAAFVRGEWHLTMKNGKSPHGLFTLIFRRVDGQWRIVHDHTSTAEPN